MRLILSILCALWLSAAAVCAAPGDILSATIRPDGWSAELVIDDMTEGGVYSFGWSSNNVWGTSAPKVVFTVTSLKPTSFGTMTTVTRSVYGTMILNQPGTTNPGDSVSGGDLVVPIALHEWVYAKDEAGAGNSGTDVTVSILNDLYVNGAANSSPVTGLAVTNNSERGFFPTDFAWSCVPFQLVQGEKLRVSGLASSHHPQDGNPVQAVTFTATDGTTSRLITATAMVKSPLEGDHKACAEYVAEFNNADFAQGATITVNAVVYPHLGDAASVLNTSTFLPLPSWKPGPLTYICDKSGTYGVTKVLVGAGGNDSTGVAYDSASYDPDTAVKCATGAGALVKALAYNTANRGRSNLGGVVIEYEAGTYAGLGGTGSFGATPPVWVTIQPRSGVTADQVVWSSTTGATNVSERLQVKKITLTTPSTQFTGVDALWLDQCVMNSTGTSVINGSGYTWVTGCDIPQWPTGLKPFSTGNIAGFVLVRGNDLSGFRHQIISPMILANVKNDRSSASPSVPNILIMDSNGGAAGPIESLFIAYNEFYGLANQAAKLWDTKAKAPWRSITVMENLFESVSNSTQFGLFGLTGGGQFNQTFTSARIWNNTMMGERNFITYNDNGTEPIWYYGVDQKNNIAWEHNIKSDLHGTASANRVGNWSVVHGVGYSGNINSDSGTDEDLFRSRWYGINSYEDNWGIDTTYFDFLDYKATIYTGQPDSLGLGNYHIGEESPAYGIVHDLVTNFDLEGNARGLPDSAGAFTTFAGDGNTPPVATITSPATGATVGIPTTLAGTATDAEDGTLSDYLTWSSNVDGALGTGASITVSLSVGVHIITASVTDSGPASDTDSITLTVATEAVPEGTIQATTTTATNLSIQ